MYPCANKPRLNPPPAPSSSERYLPFPVPARHQAAGPGSAAETWDQSNTISKEYTPLSQKMIHAERDDQGAGSVTDGLCQGKIFAPGQAQDNAGDDRAALDQNADRNHGVQSASAEAEVPPTMDRRGRAGEPGNFPTWPLPSTRSRRFPMIAMCHCCVSMPIANVNIPQLGGGAFTELSPAPPTTTSPKPA
jgi:hypothetical protein